jgi:hypothetical protein
LSWSKKQGLCLLIATEQLLKAKKSQSILACFIVDQATAVKRVKIWLKIFVATIVFNMKKIIVTSFYSDEILREK